MKDKIKIRFTLYETKDGASSAHHSDLFDLTDTCRIEDFKESAIFIAGNPEKASTKVIFAPGK